MSKSTPRPEIRRQRGVSLLECLAAMVIVGTSLVAGFSLLGMQGQVHAVEDDGWKALRFLARDLERVRSLDYEAVASTDATTVKEDTRFAISRTVSGGPGPDLLEVEVTVTWTDDHEQTQTRSVTTLRANVED